MLNTNVSKRPPQINFSINRSLKREFYAACKLQGKTATDLFATFMRKYVAGEKLILEAMKDRYKGVKDGE